MAGSVSETVSAHKMHQNTGILRCILAFAASFQKATEVNTTKIVVMKRTKVNQEKHWKHGTFRGQKTAAKGGKTAENGGKGRENGGKGRTLKIEVQIFPETCPNVFFHGF